MGRLWQWIKLYPLQKTFPCVGSFLAASIEPFEELFRACIVVVIQFGFIGCDAVVVVVTPESGCYQVPEFG